MVKVFVAGANGFIRFPVSQGAGVAKTDCCALSAGSFCAHVRSCRLFMMYSHGKNLTPIIPPYLAGAAHAIKSQC